MSSKNFNSFKDFQSDQIQTSSRKLFTAHYACSNSDLNLTPVTGTTNGFIFQIINSLIESLGVRLTCFDCKTLCWLSNWIQRIIQENAGSGERRAELRRSTRKLQSIIKVSSWRLYNVFNQQDQNSFSTIWSLIKRSLRGRRLRSNSR